MTHALRLFPWIVLNRQLKGSGQVQINSLDGLEEQCQLLTLLAIQPEQLSLISSFQLIKPQEEQASLVYLSERFVLGDSIFRVVFIPQRKTDNEPLQCLCKIFINISKIVISDINYSGVHKLKDKNINADNKFVTAGENDIFKVSYGSSKIQLVKRIEPPFLNHLEEFKILLDSIKLTSLDLLAQSFKKYSHSWLWMLNSEKNWFTFGSFVSQSYRVKIKLKQMSINYNQKQRQQRVMSKFQVQEMIQKLMEEINSNPSIQQQIYKQIIKDILEQIKIHNFSNILTHLIKIKNNFNQIQIRNNQQLNNLRSNIGKQLKLYQISQQFVNFISFQKQQQLLQQKICNLQNEKEQLKQKLSSFKYREISHINQLKEYQSLIGHLTKELESFKSIEDNLENYKILLDQERQQNQKLKVQLQSHLILSRKSLQLKVQLQNKILNQNRQKNSLLQCLQELTQQNLTLVTNKQQLEKQIEQLKQSLDQINQVQIRALRSIQNQAQIKTRLYRYQKYVSELKMSLRAYKKIQCQKINYILQQNYKQYQQLEETIKNLKIQLRNQQNSNKQLNNLLQRQRIRLAYFQKIFINNYQSQPIPQCSEQNSATDRQTQQICAP